MSYGFFSVAGIQSGTANGGRTQLGPFNVAFGSQNVIAEYTVNTTVTVPIPSGSQGVAIIPPIGSGTATLIFKTVNTDTGTHISGQQPTIIEWDTVNNQVPANIYLTTNASMVVTVEFL
jgi:hypothetical protein